ncbi:hypothetical protein ACHAO8_008604 [Botrytis cinerea]
MTPIDPRPATHPPSNEPSPHRGRKRRRSSAASPPPITTSTSTNFRGRPQPLKSNTKRLAPQQRQQQRLPPHHHLSCFALHAQRTGEANHPPVLVAKAIQMTRRFPGEDREPEAEVDLTKSRMMRRIAVKEK